MMTDEKIWKHYLKKNEQREYINYRANQISNVLRGKSYNPNIKKYCAKKVLSFEETNELLYAAIESGEPFWAGRYGMTELQTIVQEINSRYSIKDEKEKYFEALCNNAGFFPHDITYTKKFADVMLEACKGIDLHAIWPMNMEDYFIQHCESRDVQLTKLGHLEPWNLYRYQDSNVKLWSAALKGKKVLVVHPFVDTIRTQYEQNRSKIFDKIKNAEEILPEFELKTIKAVQTIAGQKDSRFETWFEALEYMEKECQKVDFDVAIVGCGAYGFPLSSGIKKQGKVVIHLGGATQLMFGIIGKRWELTGFGKKVANESWIRPNTEEIPSNCQKVEDGCYW